jgi:Holliday junction DNA helicase RuvA
VIAQIEGRVAAVRLDAAVVTVGGVGLLVHATPDTLATLKPGHTARLATSLLVREDSLTLFGFADEDARDTFELLQTVSGVGPRLALAVLAVHAPGSLRQAVASADVDALVRVPGIGRKGAQRILLELADRLVLPAPAEAVDPPGTPVSAVAPASVPGQVVTALTGLGWSVRQAEEAVVTVAGESAGEAQDASVLLRAALRRLGRS